MLEQLEHLSWVATSIQVLNYHAIGDCIVELREVTEQVVVSFQQQLGILICSGQLDHTVHMRDIEATHTVGKTHPCISQQVPVVQLQVHAIVFHLLGGGRRCC